MDRAIAVGNRICAKRQAELRRIRDSHKLESIQPDVDNSLPVTLTLRHLKVNRKRGQLIEDRFLEVDRSNRIMMQRIADQANRPCDSVQLGSAPKGMPSLNNATRRKNLRRIADENESILRRIRDVPPKYDHVRWEQDYRRTRSYLRNSCEFPVQLPNSDIRSWTKSSTRSGLLKESSPRSAELPSIFSYQFPKPVVDLVQPPTKYLAKEGRRVEDTFYLIEVSTTGSELVISAFSGKEAQDIDIRFSQAEHDRLKAEVAGDYRKLVDRVRIKNGRIWLAESA